MVSKSAPITLFEVSWEVCNKVGGIYEVVYSKALQAAEEFGDNYYLLGPDLGQNPKDFEETDEPCWIALRQAVGSKDLRCRFGRWNIPGRPKVILVNFSHHYNQNQLLYELWSGYGVDSLSGSWDYIEPVMFSTACGEVIAAACRALVLPHKGKAIAQFHEWMCGGGLLALKRMAPEVGTVFTTHATMLGRAMAGSGVDIYKQMRQISPQQEAAAYNITAKCSMESIAAREADCFTTVSRITADEAEAFLGRLPDVITVNGLDMRVIPNYTDDRTFSKECRNKILHAAGKLLRRTLSEKTRIMVISGRYEFHNKGLDVFIDALASAEQAMHQSETHVLALFTVMGGHTGVNAAAISGEPLPNPNEGNYLTSHHVYDQPNDPILNACQRQGLNNAPDRHVNIIFVPALLDGQDGFLNMSYFDILAGCDLGVFPSWYEPWGYTPHESAAYAVPTVTTDLSGFGIWAREASKTLDIHSGVTVVSRRQGSYTDTVNALHSIIMEYASSSDEVLHERRRAVRDLVMYSSWEHFFPNYLHAYEMALERAETRAFVSEEDHIALSKVLISAASATPFLRPLTAVAPLPEFLARLRELANNLWWAWHPYTWDLFIQINPLGWDACGHNPVQMIEEADPARLEQLAESADYRAHYNKCLAEFDAYMAEPVHSSSAALHAGKPVAYFSTEFGIHECLPIYSGGLGVLSGDHLKSSSDLNIPLVAVGLLYKNGYFRQKLDKDGRQTAIYPENNFATLPVERYQDAFNQNVDIELDLPGRRLFAQVWVVHVGRIKLYLLDTDTPRNTMDDRKITARLYEADRDFRLRQEILLGMGGVRLIRKLGIAPAVYHMNEGHSAFMVIERIREAMQNDGLSFYEASILVRGNTIFTTHTPVDAGNERFSTDLMERYFAHLMPSLGISWQEFLRIGRLDTTDRNSFEMTVLALRLTSKANGVSRLHGDVSRRMWHTLWKGVPIAEMPLRHVTNGIHVPTYTGPSMRLLLNKYLGQDWMQLTPESPVWEKVDAIPDDEFWMSKLQQKKTLIKLIRQSLPEHFNKFGIDREAQKETLATLHPESLIIGFARRFAPYKRATLLFADTERLLAILKNPQRPVILVFSGKAHPADTQGIDLIREIIKYTNDPRFRGHIFFLEDYSVAISRIMVQGCDVWLNTPRRPYEASGTSGQKVPVNGGINLSVSDGWWCEGYHGNNGWTIGPVVGETMLTTDPGDYADAESLYTLLEETVSPLYYKMDEAGLPRDWLAVAKNSLKSLTAMYSSDRMVSDYMKDYYIPVAERRASLDKNKQALARKLAAWYAHVPTRFATLRIEQIRVDGIAGDTLLCGQPLTVHLKLHRGSMEKAELRPQLVIGTIERGEKIETNEFCTMPTIIDLTLTASEENTLTYEGSYTACKNGRYAYGVRVLPYTEGLANDLDKTLTLWG